MELKRNETGLPAKDRTSTSPAACALIDCTRKVSAGGFHRILQASGIGYDEHRFEVCRPLRGLFDRSCRDHVDLIHDGTE